MSQPWKPPVSPQGMEPTSTPPLDLSLTTQGSEHTPTPPLDLSMTSQGMVPTEPPLHLTAMSGPEEHTGTPEPLQPQTMELQVKSQTSHLKELTVISAGTSQHVMSAETPQFVLPETSHLKELEVIPTAPVQEDQPEGPTVSRLVEATNDPQAEESPGTEKSEEDLWISELEGLSEMLQLKVIQEMQQGEVSRGVQSNVVPSGASQSDVVTGMSQSERLSGTSQSELISEMLHLEVAPGPSQAGTSKLLVVPAHRPVKPNILRLKKCLACHQNITDLMTHNLNECAGVSETDRELSPEPLDLSTTSNVVRVTVTPMASAEQGDSTVRYQTLELTVRPPSAEVASPLVNVRVQRCLQCHKDFTDLMKHTLLECEKIKDIREQMKLRYKQTCEYCGKRYNNFRFHRQHECYSHMCPICEDRFETRHVLERHCTVRHAIEIVITNIIRETM